MIIKEAIEVLKIEAEGILGLTDRIDDNFSKMVELIFNSSGRVIIGGIGKSGIVGRKIVATLNSTGTRSIFLHPVEAIRMIYLLLFPTAVKPMSLISFYQAYAR